MIKGLKSLKTESKSLKTDYDSEEVAIRLLEIHTRIADLRGRLRGQEESNQATKIEPEYEKVREFYPSENDRSSKEKELEDIKAKLLGRKK